MYNFDQLRDGNYYQGKSPLVTTLKLCSQYTGYFLRRPEKKTELIELNKTSIKIAKKPEREKSNFIYILQAAKYILQLHIPIPTPIWIKKTSISPDLHYTLYRKHIIM